MDLFFGQLQNGIVLGALYALIALGYTMVYGIIQLINFAHGEIFMIGAFGALSVFTWGSLAGHVDLGGAAADARRRGDRLGHDGRAGRTVRLPTAAPCPEAGAADHRDRALDRAPGAGPHQPAHPGRYQRRDSRSTARPAAQPFPQLDRRRRRSTSA